MHPDSRSRNQLQRRSRPAAGASQRRLERSFMQGESWCFRVPFSPIQYLYRPRAGDAAGPGTAVAAGGWIRASRALLPPSPHTMKVIAPDKAGGPRKPARVLQYCSDFGGQGVNAEEHTEKPCEREVRDRSTTLLARPDLGRNGNLGFASGARIARKRVCHLRGSNRSTQRFTTGAARTTLPR